MYFKCIFMAGVASLSLCAAGCGDQGGCSGDPSAGAQQVVSGVEIPEDLSADDALICVVRHAEAWKNVAEDQRPSGLTEAELDTLTPAGEGRARDVGAALAAALGDRTSCWASSTAGRAIQTAELAAAAWRERRGAVAPAPLEVTDALAPLAGSAPWEVRVAALEAGEDFRPSDGESFADGRDRALVWLDEASRASAGGGACAVRVLVTHGDIAMALLAQLAGRTLQQGLEADELDTGAARCVAAGAAP